MHIMWDMTKLNDMSNQDNFGHRLTISISNTMSPTATRKKTFILTIAVYASGQLHLQNDIQE